MALYQIGAARFLASLWGKGWLPDVLAVCVSSFLIPWETRAYLLAIWASAFVCATLDWGGDWERAGSQEQPEIQKPVLPSRAA